jgi:hypothetical protein
LGENDFHITGAGKITGSGSDRADVTVADQDGLQKMMMQEVDNINVSLVQHASASGQNRTGKTQTQYLMPTVKYQPKIFLETPRIVTQKDIEIKFNH